MSEYWQEVVSQALSDHGVMATSDQIAAISRDIEGAHDMYAEYSGQHVFSRNLRASENAERERLRKDLVYQQEKYPCPACAGKKIPGLGGSTRPASDECWVCDRTGLVHPDNRRITATA